MAKEKSILLRRCDTLRRPGWLQTPADVRILALGIVQKRDPDAIVGKDWIRNSPHKRHPEMESQWSQQLDRIHALRGSRGNYRAIKLCFDNVCPSHWHKMSLYKRSWLTVSFFQAHRPGGFQAHRPGGRAQD